MTARVNQTSQLPWAPRRRRTGCRWEGSSPCRHLAGPRQIPRGHLSQQLSRAATGVRPPCSGTQQAPHNRAAARAGRWGIAGWHPAEVSDGDTVLPGAAGVCFHPWGNKTGAAWRSEAPWGHLCPAGAGGWSEGGHQLLSNPCKLLEGYLPICCPLNPWPGISYRGVESSCTDRNEGPCLKNK